MLTQYWQVIQNTSKIHSPRFHHFFFFLNLSLRSLLALLPRDEGNQMILVKGHQMIQMAAEMMTLSESIRVQGSLQVCLHSDPNEASLEKGALWPAQKFNVATTLKGPLCVQGSAIRWTGLVGRPWPSERHTLGRTHKPSKPPSAPWRDHWPPPSTGTRRCGW